MIAPNKHVTRLIWRLSPPKDYVECLARSYGLDLDEALALAIEHRTVLTISIGLPKIIPQPRNHEANTDDASSAEDNSPNV